MNGIQKTITKLEAELSNPNFLSKAPKDIVAKKQEQLRYLKEGNKVSETIILKGNGYYKLLSINRKEFSVLAKAPIEVLDEMIYTQRLNSGFTNTNEAYEAPITDKEISEKIVLFL